MGSHAHHLLLVHSALVHVTGMNHVLPYHHVPYQIDHHGPVTEKNTTLKLAEMKNVSHTLCSTSPYQLHITVATSQFSTHKRSQQPSPMYDTKIIQVFYRFVENILLDVLF